MLVKNRKLEIVQPLLLCLLVFSMTFAKPATVDEIDFNLGDYDVFLGKFIKTKTLNNNSYSGRFKIYQTLKGVAKTGEEFEAAWIVTWEIKPESSYLIFAEGGYDINGKYFYNIEYSFLADDSIVSKAKAKLHEIASGNELAKRIFYIIFFSPLVVVLLGFIGKFVGGAKRPLAYLNIGIAIVVVLLMLVYIFILTTAANIRIDILFGLAIVLIDLILVFEMRRKF
jgi:hypothetical protein